MSLLLNDFDKYRILSEEVPFLLASKVALVVQGCTITSSYPRLPYQTIDQSRISAGIPTTTPPTHKRAIPRHLMTSFSVVSGLTSPPYEILHN